MVSITGLIIASGGMAILNNESFGSYLTGPVPGMAE